MLSTDRLPKIARRISIERSGYAFARPTSGVNRGFVDRKAARAVERVDTLAVLGLGLLGALIGGLWTLGGLVGAGLLLIYASLIVVPATRSVVTGGLLGTDDRSEVLARAIAAVLALCSIGSTVLY